MRKLASIRQIGELRPIEGADMIEVAVIDGWTVVVKKGEFQKGDDCVYFEIDSFLPEGNPAWQFLVDKSSRMFEGQKGHKLRSIKLRKQLSQGLVMPILAFAGVEVTIDEHKYDFADVMWEQGEDVTAHLGVKKWEDQLPANLQGQAAGYFPSFIPKTDEERCQNLGRKIFGYDTLKHPIGDWISIAASRPAHGQFILGMAGDETKTWEEAWDEAEPLGRMTHWKPIAVKPPEASPDDRYEVSIKMDGSSMTGFVRRQFTEPIVGEDGVPQNPCKTGVCSRNLQLKINEENADNTFVRYFVDNLEPALIMYHEQTGQSIALQGELMGPNIQGNREGFKDFKFFVYKIFDIENGEFLKAADRLRVFNELRELGAKMEHVPILHEAATLAELGLTCIGGLLKFAEGPSLVNPVREGLVFKRVTDSFSFKAISNAYLLGLKD